MSRRAARAARTALLGTAAAWLLAACTTLAPTGTPVAGDTLSGRLVVRVDGSDGIAPRSTTATFDLRGDPADGRLDLSTPLGTVMARARWSRGEVVLATADGERRFKDLDALTTEVLGESLPVAAMFDWLRGRPWPGAPSTANPSAGEAGFEQLGWSVGLAQFGDGWVTARRQRAPSVTVRAKLDRT